MKYIAIDVETANADYSSICQIGIAEFEDGVLISQWSTLVNPETYFDPFNTAIHGIKKSDINKSPTFEKIFHELVKRMEGSITVHHMPFDKVAINRACDEYQLPKIGALWLDSATVTRRTWEQFSHKGYALNNIAHFLGIEFKHHDALQDAIAAGLIVAEACRIKSMSVGDWLISTKKSIPTMPINCIGNPEGALFGEVLVFTGSLLLPRKEAALIASKIGCNVSATLTQKATILIVGTQDTSKLAGYEKSSKHRKAEELIAKGYPIRILSENDFIAMYNNESGEIPSNVQ